MVALTAAARRLRNLVITLFFPPDPNRSQHLSESRIQLLDTLDAEARFNLLENRIECR